MNAGNLDIRKTDPIITMFLESLNGKINVTTKITELITLWDEFAGEQLIMSRFGVERGTSIETFINKFDTQVENKLRSFLDYLDTNFDEPLTEHERLMSEAFFLNLAIRKGYEGIKVYKTDNITTHPSRPLNLIHRSRLTATKVSTLEDLSKFKRSQILEIDQMGPKGIQFLEAILDIANLQFAAEGTTTNDTSSPDEG